MGALWPTSWHRRHARHAIAGATMILSIAAPAAPRADEAQWVLLGKVASHVDRFQREFSRVVGQESYTQTQHEIGRNRTRTRHLLSEVFFFGTTDEGGALVVRNVRRVDGRAVRDVGARIAAALAMPPERRWTALRALADANARYNLGPLRRNFNEPTLALLFASSSLKPRFAFTGGGQEVVEGRRLSRLDFSELLRPTVIRDGRSGSDLPASGTLWVDDNGVVWRTKLALETFEGTYAEVKVSYGADPRLDVMVPVAMEEDYRVLRDRPGRGTLIMGRASYSDYRRFETSGRVLTP